MAAAEASIAVSTSRGHAAWVRVCHWLIAAGVVTLAVSGFVILMAHPRLYWGEIGNDLTPALLELPLSHNHRPEGWQVGVTFSELTGAPVSAIRTYDADIFNENSWARSLHFLAAWIVLIVGFLYAALGAVTGHVRRDLLPQWRDLAPGALWRSTSAHLRLRSGGGAPYGVLQRCAYLLVAFALLPLMVLTGLTMAPAVTAAYPSLLDVFGGQQTARTVHFFGFAALTLFLIVHVALVIKTGFRRQMRSMILGS
jgi:thiosulfate reductase cytochrome b subunit